jgi:hypothetical protein
MGSSRHWNVARHILRLHEGLGEPVNEFGKTKEQCQIDMNLPFIHNHQNAQKLAAFSHDQFKESRFSATRNCGIDNNNERWWDFMDRILEPVKKISRIQQRTLNVRSADFLSLSLGNFLSISITFVDPYQL